MGRIIGSMDGADDGEMEGGEEAEGAVDGIEDDEMEGREEAEGEVEG